MFHMEHVFSVRWLKKMPRHRFITCPVAKAIWVIISQIWASITGNILSPYKWVFMEEDKTMPTPSFCHLRYWGMWCNWTMRNGFLFDGLHGVTQLRRMKGKLIWQFSHLCCCMGTLSQEEMGLCHLVLQHFDRVSFTLSLFMN